MRLQPEGIFIDFYGTITDGDREAVERICAIVVHDHNLPVRAEEFAVQWGEAFFAEIDRSNGESFRTMFECECRSLTSTLRRYGRPGSRDRKSRSAVRVRRHEPGRPLVQATPGNL